MKLHSTTRANVHKRDRIHSIVTLCCQLVGANVFFTRDLEILEALEVWRREGGF